MSDATESSLPLEAVSTFASSPLFFAETSSPEDMSDEMNNNTVPKDEPASQFAETQAQSTHRRTSSGDTERPQSAQQNHGDIDSENEEPVTQDQDEEDSDPAERIEDFNWEELVKRFHKATNECTAEEAHLMEEWQNLMVSFQIWAESGHAHESDRTFRRLTTRQAYVQNEEDKLEKTREHYVNVVKAFESALSLLQAHGFGG